MRVFQSKRLRLDSLFWFAIAGLFLLATLDFVEVASEGLRVWTWRTVPLTQLLVIGLLCAMMVAIRRDVRARYAAAAALIRENSYRISHDDLTGALSRYAFLAQLNERLGDLRSAQIHSGHADGFALALIDVDAFKAINDTHGHPAGDRILKLIVDVARKEPGWKVGRLGGDEFGVILPSEDEAVVTAALQRFSRNLMLRYAARGSAVSFQGISIGFALAPEHATSENDLIQAADMALYFVKSTGKGSVSAFNKTLRLEFNSERNLMRELRAAILLNHLDIHYQPLTDGAGRIGGAEALVRWRHPVMGNISPGIFIPIAERHGMIAQVTGWVFRRVCQEFSRSPFPYVSVNLSASLLGNAEVIADLYHNLNEHGLEPNCFVLEITETAVVNASDTVIGQLERLRNDGFRIALDDFGTGHCHFTALRHLPVDIVKIDRSYVQKLHTDRVAQIFVAATHQVAEALGLTIVAEGVETPDQRELARLCGATVFQGYLEGRPAPLPQRAGEGRAGEIAETRGPKSGLLGKGQMTSRLRTG